MLRVWQILRIIPYFALTSTVAAQSARDTARAIANIDRDIAAVESALERDVWPGYYFTRMGVMYVIPGRAKIAAHWPAEAPTGMQPLEGFAGIVWTDTAVVRWQGGLPVASLSVSATASRAAIAGLAMHEAFHAFEVTKRTPGRHFANGENSLVTARYPVFDVDNEAQFAVEAQLLRNAVLAKTDVAARANARQFLAVRQQRQARLDSTFVNYEKAAELHEGMAQYTMLQGLTVLARHNGVYADGAEKQKRLEGDALRNTLSASNLSVRRRAYSTGSYMGLLLDRLAGSAWKLRVMQEDEWLQDILANAVGTAPVSKATQAQIDAALPAAMKSVSGLRLTRVQQRDSALAAAALLITLDPIAMPGKFEWCNFDPQNLLATGSGQLMHTRMVSFCSNGVKLAGFFQAAVEDQTSGRIQTAVDPAKLQFTIDNKPGELPAAGTSLQAEHVALRTDNIEIELARALLVRGARTLLVVPLR